MRARLAALLSFVSLAAQAQSLSALSKNARRELIQEPAGTGCTLRCVNLETKQDVWTASSCIASRGDRVFVDDRCERSVVFLALPETVGHWRASPVARVFKRGEKANEFYGANFVRVEKKVRELTRRFEWLAGVNSARGVPPRLRDDGLGVDFEAIDGTRHMLPFEPGLRKVELLNPGAEPRAPLRYDFARGKTEKGTLTQELEVTSELIGRTKETVKDPPFTIKLAIAHGGKDAKGNFSFAFRIADVGVELAAVPSNKRGALADAVRQIKARKGKVTVDARGRVEALGVEVAEDEARFKDARARNIDKALEDALPLPEQPVGIGAKWQSTFIDASGQDLMRAEFELVERSGAVVTLKISAVQESYSRNLVLPDLPPGVSVWVDRSKVTVDGRRTLDLTRAIPNATAVATGDILLTVQGPDHSADVRVRSKAKVQISDGEPKVAAPAKP